MNARVRPGFIVLTAVLLGAVGIALVWNPRSGSADRATGGPARRGAEPAVPRNQAGSAVPDAPARNVFEYERAPDPPRLTSAPPPVALVPTLSAAPTPGPVRLVGFVRKAGTLQAALAIRGDVLVLGVGEGAAGYVLLAIDEEAGATVRGPDGAELRLQPGSP